MYKQIVNPATGRKVNVDGKIGKQVLHQYKEQLGGFKFGNPFGKTFDDFQKKRLDNNLLLNLIELVIRNNPTKKYFLIDWKRKFNSNKKCYTDLETPNEKDIFWDLLKKQAEEQETSVGQLGSKDDLFRQFKIVKLNNDYQGVYGNDCSTGLTKSFTKWSSRNTTAAGKNIKRGLTGARANINLAGRTIREKGITKATQLGAKSLGHSVGKAAMATRQGFTTATSAAKRGITDWHHQSLGKNNYIKSLIREIISTTNEDIKQIKLKELQKIDDGKFVEMRNSKLGLPTKSEDCIIKKILDNNNDKLIEVCSPNDKYERPHPTAIIPFVHAVEGGGKRRNAKRTYKKRNASKKRHNTSKNNNRR